MSVDSTVVARTDSEALPRAPVPTLHDTLQVPGSTGSAIPSTHPIAVHEQGRISDISILYLLGLCAATMKRPLLIPSRVHSARWDQPVDALSIAMSLEDDVDALVGPSVCAVDLVTAAGAKPCEHKTAL